MDFAKVYDDAVAVAKQAVEADVAGDYEKALDLYMNAVERFNKGLSCTSVTAGGLRCT